MNDPRHAVRLAMRAPRTWASVAPEPDDEYATRPTVVDEPPTPLPDPDEDTDDRTRPAVLVTAEALLSVDEAPAEDDTSWGTPAYGARRVAPVTAADIPERPYGAPSRTAEGRRARPARVRGAGVAAADAVIAVLALWTTAAAFATMALVVAVLGRLAAG